ncbi:MAG: permease-like cell division protein FtsX [candidate division WOR-3 bacterium]|jgi:cell division transport system permease protein
MFLISESFRFLFTRKNLSLFVIISNFLLFSILGITTLITYQIFQYLQAVRNDIEIQAFLKPNLSSTDSIRIFTILSSLSGIENIKYKSSKQAYEELLNSYKDYRDVFADIDINQLPSAYIIKPKMHWTKGELLDELSNKIKMLDGIEDVYYGKNWIYALEKLSGIFIIVSIFVLILIFFTFIFISSYAIKIAINDHKLAMEILKLSGIEYFRIYAPFRIMGIFYGFIPSLLTFLFLNGLIYLLKNFGFKLFSFPSLFLITIILFGTIMGILSAENALRENS